MSDSQDQPRGRIPTHSPRSAHSSSWSSPLLRLRARRLDTSDHPPSGCVVLARGESSSEALAASVSRDRRYVLVDLSLVFSAVAVLVSGAALGVSIWQPFQVQRLTVAQIAATAMIDSVGALREAIWAAAEVRPDPDVMARLAYDLDRTCRSHHASFPAGLRSMRRAVRAAATNYLGGASGYAVDPRLRRLPFSEHERLWWDITTTYLDYVVYTLGKWRSHPTARRVDLTPFHQWRRDEDEAYHAWHRGDQGGMAELCAREHKPASAQSPHDVVAAQAARPDSQGKVGREERIGDN